MTDESGALAVAGEQANITRLGASPVNGQVPPLATRWKPGQSGNPKGRPCGTGLTDRLRALLATEENGKLVAQRLVEVAKERAEKGDFRYFKEIIDRMDGPIRQLISAEVDANVKHYVCKDDVDAV